MPKDSSPEPDSRAPLPSSRIPFRHHTVFTAKLHPSKLLHEPQLDPFITPFPALPLVTRVYRGAWPSEPSGQFQSCAAARRSARHCGRVSYICAVQLSGAMTEEEVGDARRADLILELAKVVGGRRAFSRWLLGASQTQTPRL